MAISATAIDPQQQERVRAAMREMRAKVVNQAALGRLLHVKQQSISRALAGGPVGVRLATAVAKRRGQSLEELLEGRSAPRTFGDLDGWPDAVRVAVEQRRVTPVAAATVARWPAFLHVKRAEPRLVVDLVALWVAWEPPEDREVQEPHVQNPGQTVTPASGTLRVPSLSERRPKQPAEK